MLEIKVKDGEDFLLTPGKFYLIGGKSYNKSTLKISLGNDKSLDSKHAVLEIENDETAYIIDLQSDTGTFINGRRLEPMIRAKITVNDSLRFGLCVIAKLRTRSTEAESHESSGFHDSHKNTSDIIVSSPEISTKSQSIRPNDLLPTAKFPRPKYVKATKDSTSISLNSSTNSTSESGFPEIPETQYFHLKRHSLATANVSVADSDCFDKTDDNEADVFIPETQEAPIRFQMNNDIVDANLSASQLAPNASQFRICTQLFNEDCNLDINSNSESDDYDILNDFRREKAFEKHSMKTAVQTKAIEANADDEEMCALNWSAPTSKSTTLNVTAVEVFRDDASTPDLCDFPEEEQEKIRSILNASSSGFAPPKAKATTNDTPAEVLRDDASTPDLCDFTEAEQEKVRQNLNISSFNCAAPKEEALAKTTKLLSTNSFLFDKEENLAPKSKNTTLSVSAAEIIRDDASTPDLCDFTEEEQENIRSILNASSSGFDPPKAKANTTNATAAEVLRDDASTPDLCDFTEEEQEKVRQNLNASSSNCAAPKAAAKTTVPSTNSLPLNEEEDLMPTQVFVRKTADKKPQIQEEPKLDKAEPGCLTLSGKENMGPTIDAAILEVRDEIFTKIEASTSSATLIPIKSTASANPTTEPEKQQDDNLDDFAPTQLFPTSKATKGAQKTNISSANEAKNCFNSTLLVMDEKTNVKKETSFFKDLEKTAPAKIQSENAFKKPDRSAFLKTVSSTSNAASSLEPPIDSESEMFMCTPKFLREQFVDCSAAAVKQNLIAAKQKSLFGDDSDEEDEDILKLINAPKTSKDFDILQPKEKSLNCSYKKTSSSTKAKQDEPKSHKTKQNRNRDERHSARDNERFKTTTKPQSTKAKNEVASSISTRKRKTSSKLETSTEIKIVKVDIAKSEVKEVKKLDKTKSKTYQLEANDNQSANDDSKKQSHDTTEVNQKKINMPNRRITRLQSRTTVTEEAEEVKTNAVSRTTKASICKTRTRLITDSQESGRGSSALTPESANEPNDKKQKQPLDETKRLQSTSSQDDSKAISSNKNSKLKLTTTMVDPKRFKQLSKISSGKWIITNDPVDSDILIMDKANRTFKFLIAMAKGIPIVTSNWLEYVNSTNNINIMAEHIFTDSIYEKRHKFTLSNSLEKARKHRLFAGYDFLMTSCIQPNPEEMEAIVKCAGGTVRTDPPPPLKDTDTQKLYLISSERDKKHWHKYRRVNNNIRIISSEGVMSSVMRQQVETLDKFLLS